jgi:hypothetical protein
MTNPCQGLSSTGGKSLGTRLASSEGLGAVLLQTQQPVAYASKPITECQKRYAQIEKELLVILYGGEHFHQYIYGRTVVVETDQKPLL